MSDRIAPALARDAGYHAAGRGEAVDTHRNTDTQLKCASLSPLHRRALQFAEPLPLRLQPRPVQQPGNLPGRDGGVPAAGEPRALLLRHPGLRHGPLHRPGAPIGGGLEGV
eukprot:1029043-Prorocentrum_minimum.AAC.1